MAEKKIEDVIDEVAQGPASASSDGGSMSQQRLPDLIAADKYRAAKKASGRNLGGVRFVKMVPPPING